jgi:DNA-binding NtrC family response regulator
MEPETLKKVLVVDDEEIFRNLLQKTLVLEGFTVETAKDGVEGIQALRESPFSIVLTDLMMPKAGGIEVLKAAKAIDPSIAVIIITGYASLDSALAAIREGAYDYITKPFQLEEIRLTVSNANEMQRLITENRLLMENLNKAYKQLATLMEDKEGFSDKFKDINGELERRQREIFDSVQALRANSKRNYHRENREDLALESSLNMRRFQKTAGALGMKNMTSPGDLESLKKQILGS